MKPEKHVRLLASASAALLLVAAASTSRATTITFDDGLIATGGTLSNQYASLGVTFAPGGGTIMGVVNPASTTQGFATNTSLLVNVPGSTTTAPISGNVVHTTSGWLNEDGDPVFTMTFASAVSFLSLDFGAVGSSIGQPSIFALNPATNIAISIGAPTVANGTVTTAGIPAGATTFVVLPGSFGDYVGIDNINFTVVPEPSTYAMMAGGLGLLLVGQRFRRSSCRA